MPPGVASDVEDPEPRAVSRRSWRHLAPSLAILGLGLVFAGLRSGAPDLYRVLMTAWIGVPGPFPFFDLHGLLTAEDCTRRGLDVLVANPCDLQARGFNYPRLWLLPASVWSFDTGMAPMSGTLLLLAFAGWMLLLPPATGRFEFWLRLAAIVSPPVALALERMNPDVLMFMMVGGAALLAGRPRAGLLGYALLLSAALLKLYSMALLPLPLVWEHRRRGLFLAALLCLVAAAYLLSHLGDLALAMRNMPTPDYFEDMFGARVLPDGLRLLTERQTGAPVWLAATAALLALALLRLRRVFTSAAAADFLNALPDDRRRLLLAGGGAVLVCFLLGNSAGYRAIFLLLALPALGWGGKAARGFRPRHLALRLLSLLWLMALPHLLGETLPQARAMLVQLAVGVAREGLWWFTMADLAGLLIRLVGDALYRRFAPTEAGARG